MLLEAPMSRRRQAMSRRASAAISSGPRGEFVEPSQIEEVVLRSLRDEGSGRLGRVTVGDIATVSFDHKEPGANIRILGQPAMAVNAQRETGANVIDTMAGIKEAVDEMQSGPLPDAGLTIRQVYDETVYIDSAINLVNQNILVGGALAALMLLLFLRSGYATLIVSIAIPVSVVASFVAMAFMGRSLNVISLAGIAFAVGMVVDCSDRGSGEHLSPSPGRDGAGRGCLSRSKAGLGCHFGLGAHHGDGLHSDSHHEAGSRPAVPGYRGCDLGCGHAVARGGDDRHSGLVQAVAHESSACWHRNVPTRDRSSGIRVFHSRDGVYRCRGQ